MDYVVLATGASQQHAYACVDAVRWQLQQQLSAVADGSGDASGRAPANLLAASTEASAAGAQHALPSTDSSSGGGSSSPAASAEKQGTAALMPLTGGKEAEWSVLQAGRLELHVLTGRARQYYNLEQLWAGAGARVTRFVAEQPVMTKDTIMCT